MVKISLLTYGNPVLALYTRVTCGDGQSIDLAMSEMKSTVYDLMTDGIVMENATGKLTVRVRYYSAMDDKYYFIRFDVTTGEDDSQVAVACLPFGHCLMLVGNEIRLKRVAEATAMPDDALGYVTPSPLFSQQLYIADDQMKYVRKYYASKVAQYCYRIVPWFVKPDAETQAKEILKPQPEFRMLHVSRLDGTYDKSDDNSLTKHSMAAKPYRIAAGWTVGKSEFSAFFWIDEEELGLIFDRFYGAHRDTPGDFIISVDPRHKRYGLFLYRQGLREPVEIPAEVYELIVFKNDFEHYRSKNYSQPDSAWIW